MTVSCKNFVIIPKAIMPILLTEPEFQSFRGQLYNEFDRRADSAMDLLDALCSNNHAPSVVHLSLNPLFRGGYSSLFKAIGESLCTAVSEEEDPVGEAIGLPKEEQFQCLDLISQVVPHPKQYPFFLFGMDCTSIGRPFAPTLEDRGMIHQPTVIKGNKPITIGHSYSMVAVLPERTEKDAPWTIPLDMRRVPTESSSTLKGIAQLNVVLSNPNVPWAKELCVLVVDSAYGNKNFLSPLHTQKNLVIVVRSRSNRVFYQSPVPCEAPPGKGHPTWYGERFDLKDKETWHEPSEVVETSYQTSRGRTMNVTITAWHEMLMRGSKDMAMHLCPFTLLRIETVDESGRSVFKPMWLIVMGERRNEISSLQAYQSYRQRFDLEHSFRFQKQNLLLNAFETPDVEHEQQWVQLVLLAYVQLWAVHFLAVALPLPWQIYIKTDPSARISPSKVQQAWNRITSQFGTPAAAPKPRGKSPGRQFGQTQPLRPRFPVVKKGKSENSAPKVAA